MFTIVRLTSELVLCSRYLPMDYIFLSALASTSILLVMMSYDIACQWWRNFYSRMENMPEDLRLSSKCTIQFRVPKLHLVGHTDKCRPRFSFNYTPRTGVTDGEGVERQWAWLNAAAPSLSMMRVGGRWDALNDYCNYWNWLKTKNLRTQLSLLFCFTSNKRSVGFSLKKKLTTILPWAIIHHRAFQVFTAGLKSSCPELVAHWEQEISEWEKNSLDESIFCPFDMPESGR